MDWQIYKTLRTSVGSCFYVADSKKFSSNYSSLLSAYKKFYKNVNIAYSYKTNYLPNFCMEVKKNGGFAEVVSSMELQLAYKLGVPLKRYFLIAFKNDHAVKLLKEGELLMTQKNFLD